MGVEVICILHAMGCLSFSVIGCDDVVHIYGCLGASTEEKSGVLYFTE